MVIAMIFAGGSGTRMNNTDIPKQFMEIEDKPIIIHTLEHFANHHQVDVIVVVCKEDWIEHLKKLIEKYGISKVKAIVSGGSTGYKSIHNGVLATAELSKCPDDIILICDGVRPMLSEKLISECILNTEKYKSAVPVTPCTDSLLYSADGRICEENYDRSTAYLTQAPQGYTMDQILWAHSEAENKGIINSISTSELFLELGEKVHLFLGEKFNIKVTTQDDLIHLRALFYYKNHLLQ